jgi:predicted  nucleic acid-binding Zn-ribbon protein
MSRIERLVRPALRRSGGRIAFPLLGLAVAGVALIAHAQIGQPAMAASTPATTPRVAAQALPAGEVRVGAVQRIARADSREVDAGRMSYAIVRKGSDSMTMSGDTRDIDGIKAIREGMDRDFLWVRKDGKAWVITDPAILGRVEQAWAGMEPLDREMDGLNAQMDVHNKKMDALNARMDALSAQQEDSPEMEAASRRMDDLGRQQETLARKQEALAGQMANAGEARQDELSREMDALSAQQDALSGQMEAQARIVEAASARMQRNAQPMEALGKQMEEAGKPMEALGKQMEALGKQMDAVSKQAERETLLLIDEAMAKGLAQPAPARK